MTKISNSFKSLEQEGCCGGGSCGTENSDEPVLSKVSKITFLIGSRSNTARNFGEKVKKYIAAFNQSIAIDQVSVFDQNCLLFNLRLQSKLGLFVSTFCPTSEFLTPVKRQ